MAKGTGWKDTALIPKKAGADEAKEFRPIALTSTISKLFERLLLKFLKPHLTSLPAYVMCFRVNQLLV